MGVHRCDKGVGQLRECEVTFASLGEALRGITRSVADLHTEVRGVREQGIRVEESQASLRRSLRDDIKPKLDSLAASAASAVHSHADECPARARAFAAASSPAQHPLDAITGSGGATRIWRIVLAVGIAIGIAIGSGLIGGVISRVATTAGTAQK